MMTAGKSQFTSRAQRMGAGTALLAALGLACSSTSTNGMRGDGGDGADGGRETDTVEPAPVQNPLGIYVVSFTPDETPLMLAKQTADDPPRAVGFTAVLKLGTRTDGTKQRVALGQLKYQGRKLGDFQVMGENVLKLSLPDRGVLIDPTLATRAGELPKLPFTVSVADDQGNLNEPTFQIPAACAYDPTKMSGSYFCDGKCWGYWSGPYQARSENCGGCGLACMFDGKASTCATFEGTSNESCGAPVNEQAPSTGTGFFATGTTCKDICTRAKGRSGAGRCVDSCVHNQDERFVRYEALNANDVPGNAGGVLAWKRVGYGQRVFELRCDTAVDTKLSGITTSERDAPADGTYLDCCCSLD